MVHADKMPKGKMWAYFLQISSKVIQVHRKQPKKVYKKKLASVEHKADIAKLEALKGTYFILFTRNNSISFQNVIYSYLSFVTEVNDGAIYNSIKGPGKRKSLI
jgi:hypothetical protein